MTIDLDKVEAALQRAAYKAVHGTREERQGRFYSENEMIIHDAPAHEGDDPVVFAALGGFTCSICAPSKMTKVEIEDFAATQFPGRWQSINKAELGMGSPTPNPCNQAPDRRMHHFMMWVDNR